LVEVGQAQSVVCGLMMFNAGNFPCLLGTFGTSAPWLGEVDEALLLETEVEATTRPFLEW